MKTSGIIKISNKSEICWMKGSCDGELYGSIWIDGQPLRIGDRSISGWWRCESPEDLEKRVRLLYGSEIELAEQAAGKAGA